MNGSVQQIKIILLTTTAILWNRWFLVNLSRDYAPLSTNYKWLMHLCNANPCCWVLMMLFHLPLTSLLISEITHRFIACQVLDVLYSVSVKEASISSCWYIWILTQSFVLGFLPLISYRSSGDLCEFIHNKHSIIS